jgi:hypothetical protein
MYCSAIGAWTWTVVDNVTTVGQAPLCVFGEAEAVPKTAGFGFGTACAAGTNAPDARAITATSHPVRRPTLPNNPTIFLSCDL